MDIAASREQGRVEVTILQPQGVIDASCFRDLIAKAEEVYRAGARDLLVDLSNITYMSSSGLMALHRIAMMFGGAEPLGPASGTDAVRAVRRKVDGGSQMHVKLLSPVPDVEWVLTRAGFDRFMEIHTDLAAAVNSF